MLYEEKRIYQKITVDNLEDIYTIDKKYRKFNNLPRVINNDTGETFQCYYRGQANAAWKIAPSMGRKKCKQKNVQIPEEADSLFAQISYLQHYQTGTRFIDYTKNIEVALYFACKSHRENNAAMFLYDYPAHHAESDTTIILCELFSMESDGKELLISVQEFSESIIKKYPRIKEKFKRIEDLNSKIISFLGHGFMVEPDEKTLQCNPRMKKQEGSFYVCGVKFFKQLESRDRWSSNAGKQIFYVNKIDHQYALNHDSGLVKIIIPKKLKPIILEELKQKGIDEKYLMGEKI